MSKSEAIDYLTSLEPYTVDVDQVQGCYRAVLVTPLGVPCLESSAWGTASEALSELAEMRRV